MGYSPDLVVGREFAAGEVVEPLAAVQSVQHLVLRNEDNRLDPVSMTPHKCGRYDTVDSRSRSPLVLPAPLALLNAAAQSRELDAFY